MAKRREDERTGGGKAAGSKATAGGESETVYVDRPWPTPKSLRAPRRLLFPEQTPDVAAAAERSRAVREDLDIAPPEEPDEPGGTR